MKVRITTSDNKLFAIRNEQQSDTVEQFIIDDLEFPREPTVTSAGDLYRAYLGFCAFQKLPAYTSDFFFDRLDMIFGSYARSGSANCGTHPHDGVTAYHGVRPKPMPSRDRYKWRSNNPLRRRIFHHVLNTMGALVNS